MKLYINGELAVKGQEVTTFRGEKVKLIGWKEPLHKGSTGRVIVRHENSDYDWEYYPSVIDGEYKED